MQNTDQEQRILTCAEQLFIQRGFIGTSTTDIAQAAGCNQALVHYYFRTKERLFQRIFENKTSTILNFLETYIYPNDIWQAVNDLIDAYFALLNANRSIPFFIINELVLNPQRRLWIRETMVKDPRRQKVYEQYKTHLTQAVRQGQIQDIEPFDLLIDVASLVVMTFVSLPLYTDMLQKSEQEVNDYLNDRKAEIKRTIQLRLTP